MILVLSDLDVEETTNAVIDWLDYSGAEYIRINGADLYKSSEYCFDFSKRSISLSNENFQFLDNDLLKVSIVWCRKWISEEFYEYNKFRNGSSDQLKAKVANHLESEFFGLTKHLFQLLRNKMWVTKPAHLRLYTSKLDILDLAEECGLSIPATIITNQKSSLQSFIFKHTTVISKCISGVEAFQYDNNFFLPYTVSINTQDIDAIPETFFPSLFQEQVEKEYEIRSFFIDGEFYSMAIFSQSSEQTKMDFRKYNYQKPTRYVPYLLPKEIENKARKLMEKIDLNCGSFDFLKSIDGRYVFLEINPTGQFGMVSYPCNYYLEEVVAKLLINYNSTAINTASNL